MSAYRVAAVVVAEPEVAWAARPKQAFARGEQRYANRILIPFVGSIVAVLTGVALLVWGPTALGLFVFFGGLIAMKIASRSDRGHDPTVAVHDSAQDDLVAWGERVAELEGPRVLGSALAGVLFGAAAEREGARRTALEYYEAALADVAELYPEALVKEVARIAAVRGASVAEELGLRERGRTLLSTRAALLEKKVPAHLALLPPILTTKRFAELFADLDEKEKALYASES